MTRLEKEKIAEKGLEKLIEQDKQNDDLKSLKYHEMALEATRKNIKRLELEDEIR